MFRALPPLERLAALSSWLRPATQKMPHNARILCPGYAEAEAAWSAAQEAALLELPRELVNLLNDYLRFKAYRIWALKREPFAVLESEAGDYVVRLWRGEWGDAWFAGVFRPGVNIESHEDALEKALCVSPTYLRSGHVSSRRLRLEARAYVDAKGRVVIAVLVQHRSDSACTRSCHLPAAMEFYNSFYGWLGTAWRVEVDPEEAMLPPMGRRVRQGDMVFSLLPVSVDTSSLPECDPPIWENSHRVIAESIRWVWLGDRAVGIVGKQVRVVHQEHPEVMLMTDGGEEFFLDAREASGYTQYIPARMVD
jgi:hypothetical protein